ncbi:hypothetical protein RF11_12085 [Thelohanellus kitauei]|uniref:Uncharacterized protein n=1 Tax=Thelohanellus kitauei TaxID=669202 RepID=A0A0C2IIM9_THEKT|nr:hypothetical protein RF11_12085 [Thelohanellus kitauei]
MIRGSSNSESKDENLIDLDTRIDVKLLNKLRNKKSLIYNSDRALSTISYIQKVLSLDTDNVVKIITDVKSLINKEIKLKEQLLANQINLQRLETALWKRNLVEKNSNSTNPTNIKTIEEELENSKNRLWAIKQIEWIITQIETVKYFVKMKQNAKDGKELKKELEQIKSSG